MTRPNAASSSARGGSFPTVDDVLAAIEIQRQFRLSWDAMVVHAAAEAGADVLWTEDLTDGQVLRGVRIQDPFASGIAT